MNHLDLHLVLQLKTNFEEPCCFRTTVFCIEHTVGDVTRGREYIQEVHNIFSIPQTGPRGQRTGNREGCNERQIPPEGM